MKIPAPHLAGATNFRELGGYPAAQGGVVRSGWLFRSDELCNLTVDDFKVLRRFDIGLVFDLRGETERQRRPSRWPTDLMSEVLFADLLVDVRAGNRHLADYLLEQDKADGARRMMLETYRQFPRKFARHLLVLFQRIADSRRPLLMHCTAGKDRTGFLSACLLHALGVDKMAIYRDYLTTNERIDLDRMAVVFSGMVEEIFGMRLQRDAIDVVNRVTPEYLDASYAAIAQDFGSMTDYLRASGVDANLERCLRDRLLETVV